MIINKNLEENLKRLNDRFKNFGLVFKPEDDVIKVNERERFFLNNNPKIKEYLRGRFHVEFNKTHLWHIGQYGISKLNNKTIKIVPSESLEVLKAKLNNFISEIDENELKESIKNTLKKFPQFFESPGAKIMHHAYKGGLLEHTIQTVEFALAIIKKFDDKDIIIDKDLILAGAILHDIGKIFCYKAVNGFFEITDIFIKQEHIISGIKLISQEIISKKIDDIIHIVASHHNLREWGSPVEPHLNEVWIIHFTENLSSKIG